MSFRLSLKSWAQTSISLTSVIRKSRHFDELLISVKLRQYFFVLISTKPFRDIFDVSNLLTASYDVSANA